MGGCGGAADVVGRIMVGVDARVPRKLIGAGEALFAAGEGAFEGLLPRMRADVTGLQRESGA